MYRTLPLLLLVTAPVAAPAAADRPDIPVADFEGETYGPGWKTTGTAFGTGPAKGTLPNQMPVTGYLGKGLVNSYLGGDAATGTLTSPPFKIERKYLNFLVGGGKYPGKTCVNLLVEGKVVRTATGPNDRPGGSERLDWHSWDVAEFEGREAVLEFVDQATGGWGHINADHVVESDTKKQAEPTSRTYTITQPYLRLPVKNGAPLKRVRFTVDGKTVREFDIELADGDAPDFWTFTELSPFMGKTLAVETILITGSKALDSLKQSADVPDAEKIYREKDRPLFHFTSRVGWLNDPNGLVFVPNGRKIADVEQGEWHLFYQHNPFGTQWGNMHWGHAVSDDLVHWKELGIGLYPRQYGDWAFSGSAVRDRDNTSGWGSAEKPPLVLAYTSTGRGECIAFSTDNGRTWTEYDQNPVVKHAGRDPRLVWYEPGKHWVMAVYDEFQGKQWIAFYTSRDLKTWTYASRIEGFYECPDLVEFTVEKKWVLSAADGKYLIGDFDGKVFKPDTKEKKQLWYGRFYAAQTYSNSPLLYRPGQFNESHPSLGVPMPIQIGWASGISFAGTRFNQQMTVPVGLHLTASDQNYVLCALPVGVDQLHDRENPVRHTLELMKEGSLLDRFDEFDLETVIDTRAATEIAFDIRGTRLVYNAAKKMLTCNDVAAPVKLDRSLRSGGSLLLVRILVDRRSIEVFANGGAVVLSIAAVHDPKKHGVTLTASDEVEVQYRRAYRMKSAWGEPKK